MKIIYHWLHSEGGGDLLEIVAGVLPMLPTAAPIRRGRQHQPKLLHHTTSQSIVVRCAPWQPRRLKNNNNNNQKNVDVYLLAVSLLTSMWRYSWQTGSLSCLRFNTNQSLIHPCWPGSLPAAAPPPSSLFVGLQPDFSICPFNFQINSFPFCLHESGLTAPAQLCGEIRIRSGAEIRRARAPSWREQKKKKK